MRAYSEDLRQRIVGAVEAGTPRREVVRLFDIAPATLKRLLKQWREQGHVHPKRPPGRRRRIGSEEAPALEVQLRALPDATLEARCQAWEEEQGVRVSVSTMSRSVARLRWTRKKSV